MAQLSGCFYVPATLSPIKQYLPRVDLSAHTTILSTISRTHLTQAYINPSSEDPVKECVYEFPLYDGVSVVGFTCRVGSRVIKGVVKEKEKAREVYTEALERGETAGWLERLETSDVFQTRIGNIPAGQKVIVDIVYIGELKHDAETDGIRFTIPTQIAPRYGTPSPESWPRGGVDADDSGGIRITVDISLEEGSFIRGIQSPSHPIAVTLGRTSTEMQEEPQMHTASATLTLGSTELDKDFVLVLLAKETATPRALLETHSSIPHQRALMVTLVPKFALPPSRPEIIFVIDRSGSMEDKIPALKSALKVFLKSLPIGVKFNFCFFGSRISFLWPKSRSYSQTTLREAMRHVDSIKGNLGDTETTAAIKATIDSRYRDLPLEIMLLTDGEIWEQDVLFSWLSDEVGRSTAPIRIFSLGIGNDISHALIEGVARAGNGFGQCVLENEKLDNKVVRMLKGALSPHITDYTLEVKYDKDEDDEDDFELVERVTDGLRVLLHEAPVERAEIDAEPEPISLFDTNADPDKEDDPMPDVDGQGRFEHLPIIPIPSLLQAPHKIPPLFPFNRTTVYLLMGPQCSQKTPQAVVLRATSPHGPLELEIPVQIMSEPGETIHQLAANKAVGDLEEGRGWIFDAREEKGTLIKERFESRFDEMVEREAVRLGVEFQVGGKWCSFVAVEDADGKAQQTRTLETDIDQRVDDIGGEERIFTSATKSVPSGSFNLCYSAPFNLGSGMVVGDRAHTAASSTRTRSSILSTSTGPPRVATKKSKTRRKSNGWSPRKKAIPASQAARRSMPSHPTLQYKVAAYNQPSPDVMVEESYAATTQPPPARQVATDVSDGYKDTEDIMDYHSHESEGETPPEMTSPDADPLDKIVALQTFQGWWKLGDGLLDILELSRVEAEKSVPGDVSSKVWATVLAIRFLEERLSDREDAWELVVEKARGWLSGQEVPGEIEAELVDRAGRLLDARLASGGAEA